MNFKDTVEKMLAAAEKKAGAHWQNIRGYLQNEFVRAKEEVAAIALEVARGIKTPAQAKIEIEGIEESLRDVQLALSVDAKAAAQDAINAALEVLRAAVNDAAKVAIF